MKKLFLAKAIVTGEIMVLENLATVHKTNSAYHY